MYSPISYKPAANRIANTSLYTRTSEICKHFTVVPISYSLIKHKKKTKTKKNAPF